MTLALNVRAHLRRTAESPDAWVVSIAAGDLLDLLNDTEQNSLADMENIGNKRSGPAGCLRTADRA